MSSTQVAIESVAQARSAWVLPFGNPQLVASLKNGPLMDEQERVMTSEVD